MFDFCDLGSLFRIKVGFQAELPVTGNAFSERAGIVDVETLKHTR